MVELGKVPCSFHGQVFLGHCSTREGSGVPRAKTEDYDRIGVCG